MAEKIPGGQGGWPCPSRHWNHQTSGVPAGPDAKKSHSSTSQLLWGNLLGKITRTLFLSLTFAYVFSNWASHYKTNCGRGYIFTSLFAFHLFTRGTLSLPKFKGILIIFKGSFLLLQWGYGFNGLLGIDFKNKIKQNPFPYGENKLQEQPIFPWHSVASPFSFLIK